MISSIAEFVMAIGADAVTNVSDIFFSVHKGAQKTDDITPPSEDPSAEEAISAVLFGANAVAHVLNPYGRRDDGTIYFKDFGSDGMGPRMEMGGFKVRTISKALTQPNPNIDLESTIACHRHLTALDVLVFMDGELAEAVGN